MKKSIPYSFDGSVLSMLIDNTMKSVDVSHPNFKKIRQALKDGDEKSIVDLMVVTVVKSEQLSNKPLKKVVDPVNDPKVEVRGNKVFYDGEEVSNGVTERILMLQEQGLPFDGMSKFLEKLYKNVSYRVRQELLSFIDRNGLTIDSDGNILLYKAVRSDYMDKYSGTIDNSPGNIVKMNRSEVDDNFQAHCSKGLHCGALEYIYWYGRGDDRIVIVKVSPANTVSVPDDCQCRKIRVCEYEVLCDYNGELRQVVYDAVDDFYSTYDDEDDDWDWEDMYDECDEDEDYDEDDSFDDGDVYVVNTSNNNKTSNVCYGKKPDGKKYWNYRVGGKFAKK